MSLRINDVAPNFKAETTKGPIDFHEARRRRLAALAGMTSVWT
jgi:hypothetical protein